ncbi:hypothetical protein [Candidatus Regiella endosymbiont of Tuberolachnus salignus]|uniref:hypothetical protein n=1 Tax=Candidatus Regiella endosymbiont of Tuberolachnus salignus TaxID=3077956 RepID=UPI0030D5BD95
MLISLMALSPQRKLHSGLSGQIKLAIYGLLSLALTGITVRRKSASLARREPRKNNPYLTKPQK